LICLIAAGEPSPGLQHAFLAWFEEARSRLAIAISIGRSTPEVTEFTFALANPVLIGSLATCGDLVISADWEGVCWDFLFSEEVRPEKSHGGVVCAVCERESKHRTFPTLEALWLDHLFRPLEDWINTKLAVAQAVPLYRTDHGGTTWARLVSAGEPLDSPTYLVPLR
jgi:hypothetical protein